MARLEEMRQQYADRADFLYVYINEAHPEDEWQMGSNEEDGVLYRQPRTLEERRALAQEFIATMDVETTTLVDDIENTANACYAAWPERIYVINTEGRIAYKGGIGPFLFDPEELGEFLEGLVGAPA